MKLNPRVSQLALYDIRGGPGKFLPLRRRRRCRCRILSIHPSQLTDLCLQVSLPISATSTPTAPLPVMTLLLPD
jgi:hypothetical protein